MIDGCRTRRPQRSRWSPERLLAAGLAVLGMACGLVWASASPSSAHVLIELLDPGDGARMQRSPRTVELFFSEPVSPREVTLQLRGHVAGRVNAPTVTTSSPIAQRVMATIADPLADDSYSLVVTATGLDGHPVSQVFDFVVGDGPLVVSGAAPRPGISGAPGAALLLSHASKLLETAGLALSGCLFAMLLAWRRGLAVASNRRLVVAGLTMTVAAAILGILALTATTAGGSAPGGLSAARLLDTLTSQFGRLMLLRCLAAGLVAVALWRLGRADPDSPATSATNLALIGGATVLLTVAASSHAATDRWAFLVLLASMAHTGAIAVWMGALGVLTRQAVRGALLELPTATGVAFARVASSCVPLALSTGIFLSWRLTGGLDSHVLGGPYGAVLTIKVILVAVVLALGLSTRSALGPADNNARLGQSAAVRRAVLVEALAGVLVLVAAGVLSTIPAN